MNLKKFLLTLTASACMITSMTPLMADTSTASVALTSSKSTSDTSSSTLEAATTIHLSDEGIQVNGHTASTSKEDAVYTSHDIIYYEDKDAYDSGNPYGEGTQTEKHTAQEAQKHTVVNITKPGTYRISGKLSYGQIFVNVGKDEADKVTLILDNVDINCTVAPAVFFYKVYECSDSSEDKASSTVDTTNAGAKVVIADDSVNTINGSHVARIYKDNADKKKLHKYDGAFYSRMSMEIDGEEKGNGILNIDADNEGLDTELHLTINGGHINITSADDGINVNEDNVSVFTMNDGYLNISATKGKEGDGIDSNGWININGGTIITAANTKSMDSGLDSDKGTAINGGTIVSMGNMYDAISDDSSQLFMTLQMNNSNSNTNNNSNTVATNNNNTKNDTSPIVIANEKDQPLWAYEPSASYQYIIFSSPDLTAGTYHLYSGGKITGTKTDGFYNTITSYTDGIKLHHGGQVSENSFNGMPPQPPEKTDSTSDADKTKPSDLKAGTKPDFKPDDSNGAPDKTIPQNTGDRPAAPPNAAGGPGPMHMQSSSPTETNDFKLSTSCKIFTNVSGN